ncbi:RsmB/NOP family class I SAM-dependent RNA methyltransferase [Pediococcus claussenii]|uniref:RNA methylase, NOL1/NOP2/sun family n=1 Tax=Pediococcus claussenii (strain ATCC BAA-344 / DSM 14800 / JCM 18046 / KCTC 3811 / LMG 21948 / P06) TaxID=701521 RepID=G8PDF9_PEDCP|nr:RsmF rRNA methyltransferase first C-terminal domain-containing protein [Pediococcus claussenii]AEV95294.1 putative RNA methylase, NOL1/NOP2/sun family [Pediococcus claussenii ATCC BAA-344]ANZ68829.1 RNA methyltransferase [Pediococcus claussenii]ANZ70645.1 RNA methyltransferase [Pediococcus claussenii]KRN19524.1 hypothetical protein IV79_GL001241 [Pediococcus claussenii]
MNLPDDFIKKYQKLLGSDATEFLNSFSQPVEKGFRINPLKGDVLLHDTDLREPISYSDWGYYGKVNGKTIDHQSGGIYSQEPSAMLVGEITHPKPGQKVLDLCAAPGGKSTYLASFMNQEGILVSNEINRGRAKILAENLERFGTQNTVILNESPDRLEHVFGEYFDIIVVDAPCSGEGMFRKDPGAVQYWHRDYSLECARRQKEILKSAMKMLAPGGQIVYSTCTFAPEEDEQIIAWLLDNYPDLAMVELPKGSGMDSGRPEWANGNQELKKAIRLFPQHFRGEGHFMAKLSLDAQVISEKAKKRRKSQTRLEKEQQRLWNDFKQSFLSDHIEIKNVFAVGNILYSRNEEIDLSKLRYIKPGWELGAFKKNRFEPSLSLVLALKKDDIKNIVQISADEWKQYVHGDTIDLETNQAKNGWVAVCVDDTIVGPAKLVNGTLKNFYPKGLRMNVL